MQDLEGGRLVEHPIRLDEMYVPALLTRETRVDAPADFTDRYEWEEDRRRKQLARKVQPWEALKNHHRFVVLGGPGIGKTTYLYHLAFRCARREEPLVENHTPIFMRFREIVDDLHQIERLEALFPKALAAHHFPNARPFIERQLAAGRALILLDGLDEISDDDAYRRLLALVQDFADRHVRGKMHKGNRNLLVVSSRTHSYKRGKRLERFPMMEVMKFDVPEVEIFVHNWFSTPAQRPLANGLMSELRRNPRFMELARTPLLLVLIAFHYGKERSLPQMRADLYQECIATRIARWNEQRDVHWGRFGKSDKLLILQKLALAFYRQQWGGLIEETSLLTWLREFSSEVRFPEGATEEDLLKEIVKKSGLLKEWAIERYGFSHQTLQEYFAAEAIKDEGPDEGAALLENHLTERAWKEIILLYAGRTPNADPLMRRILHRAEREGDALWLLAGRCLLERPRSVSPAVREKLTAGLVAQLRAAGDEAALTAEESSEMIDALQDFSLDLLPAHIQTLIETDTNSDALLAARLLPEGADPDLSAAVSRQVAELARTGEESERRAASVALGWV
ncbi:MAG: NACHT domain-containing protein, partial [Chloroflexi bacterium]|nr:NACHT domain-containing protein [Chloroflexota bacterium]